MPTAAKELIDSNTKEKKQIKMPTAAKELIDSNLTLITQFTKNVYESTGSIYSEEENTLNAIISKVIKLSKGDDLQKGATLDLMSDVPDIKKVRQFADNKALSFNITGEACKFFQDKIVETYLSLLSKIFHNPKNLSLVHTYATPEEATFVSSYLKNNFNIAKAIHANDSKSEELLTEYISEINKLTKSLKEQEILLEEKTKRLEDIKLLQDKQKISELKSKKLEEQNKKLEAQHLDDLNTIENQKKIIRTQQASIEDLTLYYKEQEKIIDNKDKLLESKNCELREKDEQIKCAGLINKQLQVEIDEYARINAWREQELNNAKLSLFNKENADKEYKDIEIEFFRGDYSFIYEDEDDIQDALDNFKNNFLTDNEITNKHNDVGILGSNSADENSSHNEENQNIIISYYLDVNQ